jgi:RNase H-like domain found in reverse transcriptase
MPTNGFMQFPRHLSRENDVHQQAFDTIKRVIARDVHLAYPDFADASDKQLGAVITHEGRPIAYYSCKLNSSQLNYTTTEKELLAIVETLKEFRTILLGQTVVIYTDHKNLTYKVFNTQRVMRWRLLIEEYGPTLEYVKGVNNVVADALSRLELDPPLKTESDPSIMETPTSRQLAEAFHLTPQDYTNTCPLTLKTLMREQQRDHIVMEKAKVAASGISLRSYHGGGKIRQLLVDHDKIIVPTILQKPIVDWYHTILCHNTISQHLTWKNLRKTVTSTYKTYEKEIWTSPTKRSRNGSLGYFMRRPHRAVQHKT